MEPWFQWKSHIEENANLQFGGHYHYVSQQADRVLASPNYSSGGLFRFTGDWIPGGRDNPNAGSLNFTFDHRHQIGSGVVPTELAQQIGFVGQTSVILGESSWDVVHLNWAQPFRDGKSGFVIGRIDPNDYFYTHGFGNPWTGFQNNELQQNTTVALPQSSWGAVAGHYFSDQVYGVVGAFDANGAATDNLDWFSGGDELWSAVEIGFVPSQAERFQKKISLTYWKVDRRRNAGIGSGDGVNLSMSWTFGDWNPFFRVGWSQGSAPRYKRAVLVGFTKKMRNGADLFGLGHNWGESSTGLGIQQTTEAFYNYYLAKNLMVTPSIQYIQNPLLNPVDNEVWVWGLRSRFTF
ncbi:MAG: carbohydrate porin [Rhizobiaceae bacterium]